jgi:hypothetical protein
MRRGRVLLLGGRPSTPSRIAGARGYHEGTCVAGDLPRINPEAMNLIMKGAALAGLEAKEFSAPGQRSWHLMVAALTA